VPAAGSNHTTIRESRSYAIGRVDMDPTGWYTGAVRPGPGATDGRGLGRGLGLERREPPCVGGDPPQQRAGVSKGDRAAYVWMMTPGRAVRLIAARSDLARSVRIVG
jgi:hypothetical protein